ncbi:histone-fold-containing protein [Sistotremastrum suecicum HHB10207 ss-3]|uniref:DNA polymerase epsilon subunit D n=1 Tax=Sistotremastrum suecicum HHB10207 ss-3 TaxID=1314776 RepID=A0A166DDL7_9AGAM|nr:histone-fold-containing protein [Sistotremastrum suecicum HHB10207 ss-3]
MPRKESTSAPQPATAQAQQEAASEGIESFELPKALVTRIAKSALPDNVKLQKDTVLSLVKGSTVFINYLAATAHDIAMSRSHKTISGADVLKALESLEFGDISKQLQLELEAFRVSQKTDKGKKAAGPTTKEAKGKGKEKDTPKITIRGQAKNQKASVKDSPFTSTPLVQDTTSKEEPDIETMEEDETNTTPADDVEEPEEEDEPNEVENEEDELEDEDVEDSQNREDDSKGVEDGMEVDPDDE